MNKEEFLKELAFYLQKMKDSEKHKFINYYEEIISDYIENGVSEEEAILKIGSPKKIAQELLENNDTIKINMPSTGSRVLNLLLLFLGFPLWGSLLLAAILLILSAYIVLWCVPIVTGSLCIGFFFSSIVSVIGSPFVMMSSLPVGIVQLGFGVAAVGVSLFCGFITVRLSEQLFVITKTLNQKIVEFFQSKVAIR